MNRRPCLMTRLRLRRKAPAKMLHFEGPTRFTGKRTGKVNNVLPCRTSCPGYGYVLDL